MNARNSSGGLAVWIVALSVSALSGCLETGKSDYIPHEYSCGGVRCVNSIVGRSRPSSSDEAEPGSGCHVSELGRCIDGCVDLWPVRDLPGCPVAYACNSWERVEPGAPCQTRFDCEPGVVDGVPVNTLDCMQGGCVDLGQEKWGSVDLEPVPCDGKPYFGPHPQCPTGATCLSRDYFEWDRFCTIARCLDDTDCPDGWSCRCQEEPIDFQIKAWRLCVPIELPDAGSPPDAGEDSADAGDESADAGVEPPDAGDESPDAGVEPPDAGDESPDAS